MRNSFSNSTKAFTSENGCTGIDPSNYIVDSNTMNVHNPKSGYLVMSLLKKCFSSSKHCVFAILFVLSNLLFFQTTQAQDVQLNDPYDGFDCGDTTECPWENDSLEILTPGTTNCYSKLYYKKRTCNGILEIQPKAANNPGCAMIFYGDTNSTDRLEQLLKLAEKDLVQKEFTSFFNSRDSANKKHYSAYFFFSNPTDSALISDSTFKIIFNRPQCRNTCIQYSRDSASPITSAYAEWVNCGEACCKVTSELALDTFKFNNPGFYMPPEYYRGRRRDTIVDSNYVRVNKEVELYGAYCTTYMNLNCPNNSLPTKVFKQRECRDYCTEEFLNGIDVFGLPSTDNSRLGVINMNKLPFLSEKEISTIPNDILLEATTNEIIVEVSIEVHTIKVITLEGVVVKSIINKNVGFQSISTTNLQNGFYLLIIETKNGTISKPIIIAK